ncbi:MAG: DEAD/DEAH box helicase [Acidimicrobiia bacterium]|nr:DEAD/DEAH box helicase [Acidimicrobiia bacterium]
MAKTAMPEVWIRRQRWRIVDERRGDGLIALRVSGRHKGSTRSFLLPCDAAVPDRGKRPRRVGTAQALARLAGHVIRSTTAFTPASLCHARLTILPFQLEPTLAVCAGRRRVLIADGVGMGKTVQAGLLLHTIVARQPDARCLVVAPATLLHQWAEELRSRFSLTTRVADTPALARLRAAAPYLSNPWFQPGIWLASPDFLKQPHVHDAMPATPWSLLVCDEAHQLSGDSQRHQAIHRLAAAADAVLLLTATPHDGDAGRYRRLLALGSCGDALTIFQRSRPRGDARRRTRWVRVPLSAEDVRVLRAIDAFERTTRPADALSGLGLICALFRRRALSSPAALGRSLERRLMSLDGRDEPRDVWQQQGLFDNDILAADENEILSSPSGVPLDRERAWIRRLQHLCSGDRHGGRTRGLAALLRRSHDAAVIFTHYRDSLPAILAALPSSRQTTTMHGGMTPVEQQQAVRAFLDRRVDTLVATDVASQGLNLQSAARWAINFDVPWTPLRLEQRIGRVDRIGQTRRVHATILTTRHRCDVDARERLHTRAQASEQAPLASCRRWTLAAEGVARWTGTERRLATHWRHHVEPRTCEASVTSVFVKRWLGHAADGIACYEVPFVLSTGEVIERRVVAVPLDTPVAALIARFAKRAAALTRRLQLRAMRRDRCQHTPSAVTQPGLFTRATHDGALQTSAPYATHATYDGALKPSAPYIAHATHVSVGAPRLLVRFVRRS